MQPKEPAEHHQTILLLGGSWEWCNLIPRCSEKTGTRLATDNTNIQQLQRSKDTGQLYMWAGEWV